MYLYSRYTNERLQRMARAMKNEPIFYASEIDLMFEDMTGVYLFPLFSAFNADVFIYFFFVFFFFFVVCCCMLL